MSSPIFPRALEARETLRQTVRAGLEALLVLAVVGGVTAFALRLGGGGFRRLDGAAVGVIVTLSMLAALLYHRGRIQALRNAHTLSKHQERLAAVIEGTGVGYWEALVGRDAIFISDRWAQMVGLERDHAEPMAVAQWRELVHPDDLARVDGAIDACFTKNDYVFQLDYRLRHSAGHWIWVLSRGTVIERAANGSALRVVGTQLDITPRKAVEIELAEAARRDRLTGLANRLQFMERLRESIERVNDGRQKMLAVLFLDFDRFKVVNDAMGHQAGDELLMHMADRLRRSLRNSERAGGNGNQIARFGGDEFLMLLNDIERTEDAARIAERLLVGLSQPYRILGREVNTTASIGIVSSEHGLADAETVVRNADLAMYEAKRAGRACCVMFNDTMHTRLTRNLSIESGLRQALGTGQLSLVYQPIVDLDTGRRSSVEALIRWNHPVLGAISPAEFVPIAEESGLIVQLGEWVMRESCAALSRWQQLDPDKAPQVVSVNVSRAELAQASRLLKLVRETLAAAQLPPRCLQLEVTEREVMRDPAASLALMHQLRDIGVRLAMDDFGTGTSSLGCLSDYPFDVIKIDRSFVNGLSSGPDKLAVIHATITLVENLGKSSVGEGVETAEQLAILQSMGCHYAQGYFLGWPLAEAEVVAGERTIIAPRLQLSG